MILFLNKKHQKFISTCEEKLLVLVSFRDSLVGRCLSGLLFSAHTYTYVVAHILTCALFAISVFSGHSSLFINSYFIA